MKTPIQQLMDSIGLMAQGLPEMGADEVHDLFMKEAIIMLEKEKEMIIETSKNSYIAGYLDNQAKVNDSMNFPEEYYNETFNTKER